MSDATDHLEKRLSKLERLILELCGQVIPDNTAISEMGPPESFTKRLSKEFTDLDFRMMKLEVGFVSLKSMLNSYIGKRIAFDRQLHKRADAVGFNIDDVQERLDHVELRAFPEVAEEISSVIGTEMSSPVEKNNVLDRRKIPPTR